MTPAPLGPYKVLFVDDEAMAAKYFSQTLEDLWTVLTAGSVDEAIAILDAEHAHIGVLVTDQRMPGKQGVALLEYARQHYPQIPRILATAYADLSDAIAAVNSGEIFRYIKKPWDPDQLAVDIKIAMNIFTLTQERDELIEAKMSVFQQLVLLGRVKDLLLISAALQAQAAWPQAQTAMRNFLSNAQQVLNTADTDFVLDIAQLDLGHNLVLETQRSSALIAALLHPAEPAAAPTLTPAEQSWQQTLQAHRQALAWPEHPAAYGAMQKALLRCYQHPPVLKVTGHSLTIEGDPAHDLPSLWGVLTAHTGADLTPALNWLRFYLWASESGLTVGLGTHSNAALCITLSASAATAPAEGSDAQWLDDLFDRFSQ